MLLWLQKKLLKPIVNFLKGPVWRFMSGPLWSGLQSAFLMMGAQLLKIFKITMHAIWNWSGLKTQPVALWIKLCATTSGVHTALLFLMFFMYKGDGSHYKVEINHTIDADTIVVFLPLQKRVASKSQAKKGKGKKPQAAKAKEPAANKVAKAEKPATGLASEKSPEVKKDKDKNRKKQDDKQKKEADKRAKLRAEKEAEEKKRKDKIKEEQPKNEPVKPQPVEQEKIEESLDLKATETAADAVDNNEEQNVVYIGQADLDAMHVQAQLMQTVGQYWKPPVGIAKDKMCEIKVVIDWEGNIKDLKITKASGAVMYDVSARTAVRIAEYPKELWGKECTITFKQS